MTVAHGDGGDQASPGGLLTRRGEGREARLEAAAARLAHACGLPVSLPEPILFNEYEALLIERFDRVVAPNGRISRVHREDFAQALGFDPTIGVLHSSSRNRTGLVYDLMEPLRPHVDRKIIGFALAQTFTPSDFTINRIGGCRINPQMARAIVRALDLSAAGIVQTFRKQMLRQAK